MRGSRLARWWQRLWAGLRRTARQARGQSAFLCDDCRWNWRSACHRRERPNAVDCPDYRSKGR